MVNDVELAQMFVNYKSSWDNLIALEQKIKDEIFEREESVKIAGVKATYYKPSRSTDYEAAAKSDPRVTDEVIKEHSTETLSTRWKDIVAALEINTEFYMAWNPARVVVKNE